MRFRRAAFRGKGRAREPGIWTRSNIAQTATSCLDTNLTYTIADPASLPAVVGTDQRYTAQRLMLNMAGLCFQLTTPVATAVGDTWIIFAGIFMGAVSETAPNPQVSASVDDWLWLGSFAVVSAGTGAQTLTHLPNWIHNNVNQPGLLDIKSKRKLDSDEVYRLVLRVRSGSLFAAHDLTAATAAAQFSSSVLWKRTMR